MKLTQHDLGALLALALASGCASTNKPDEHADTNGQVGEDRAMSAPADGAIDRSNDAGPRTQDAGTAAKPDAARPAVAEEACASVRAIADRLPVHLAFAFDVSGSMGKGNEPWHDKSLKWDPVVKATRSFFETGLGTDQAGAELSASLTFFPTAQNRCDLTSYTTPNVPMTRLPSTKFGEAILAVEPKSEDDWLGGTPTLFALRGTRTFVEMARAAQPGKYAIVLVTDGYPEGCEDEEDSIEAVVAEASVARAAGISTYVIGVANPDIEDAPDTVTNLGQVAVAGGTERAFLLDTGDPEATTNAFDQAVARIREATVSCNVAIPMPPDGRPFDKRRVVVRTSARGMENQLSYDATCGTPNAWRYDNEATPTEVVLCPSACSALENDSTAQVNIDFACEDVLLI